MMCKAGLVLPDPIGYKCSQCGVSASRMRSILKHWHTHPMNGEQDPRAAFYMRLFTSRGILSTALRCHVCSNTFTDSMQALDHIFKHHWAHMRQMEKHQHAHTAILDRATGWVRCMQCRNISVNICAFLTHAERQHHQTPQPTETVNPEVLRNMVTVQGYIMCRVCQKVFACRSSYMRHAASHIKTACAHCNRVFVNARGLANHQRNNTCTTQTLTCTVCKRVYTSHNGLKYHITRIHSHPAQ